MPVTYRCDWEIRHAYGNGSLCQSSAEVEENVSQSVNDIKGLNHVFSI